MRQCSTRVQGTLQLRPQWLMPGISSYGSWMGIHSRLRTLNVVPCLSGVEVLAIKPIGRLVNASWRQTSKKKICPGNTIQFWWSSVFLSVKTSFCCCYGVVELKSASTRRQTLASCEGDFLQWNAQCLVCRIRPMSTSGRSALSPWRKYMDQISTQTLRRNEDSVIVEPW